MVKKEMIYLEWKYQTFLHMLCACDSVYGSQWIHMKDVFKKCFEQMLFSALCTVCKSCDTV